MGIIRLNEHGEVEAVSPRRAYPPAPKGTEGLNLPPQWWNKIRKASHRGRVMGLALTLRLALTNDGNLRHSLFYSENPIEQAPLRDFMDETATWLGFKAYYAGGDDVQEELTKGFAVHEVPEEDLSEIRAAASADGYANPLAWAMEIAADEARIRAQAAQDGAQDVSE